MDLTALEREVLQLIDSSVAPSTRRSYRSAQNRYISFCQLANVTPFPVSTHILCQFVAFLGSQGLKHQTVKSYLSAVRHAQITALADPGGCIGGTCTPLRALCYIVLYSCAPPSPFVIIFILLCTPFTLRNCIHTLVHPHLRFVITSWICPSMWSAISVSPTYGFLPFKHSIM